MAVAGAVAAPQASAADAGARALRSGGNALDAALAAAASLTVTDPQNCALGGDLVALVARPGHAPLAVNASGPAPQGVSAGELAERHGARLPVDGPDTVTVPGCVAGLHRIWSLGAALPWEAVFAVAIDQAAGGVAVAPALARSFAAQAGRLRADAGARSVFLPDGRPLRAGERLVQPALAATLRHLAEDGPGAFYRGPLGASVVGRLRALGSPMEAGDLAGFEPEVREPLRRPHGGGHLLTSWPNTQGVLLPMVLEAAARAGIADPLGPGAARLARIMLGAIRVRERHLGDPRFAPVDVDALLAPEHLDRLERLAAGAGPRPRLPGGGPGGDTVAVVAADGLGNAVCLIQSVFHSFGSGIVDPGTGIVLHNRGAFFSLDPASPNVIAPGKRPVHTLMPSMLVRADGSPAVVLGTRGGSVQPQVLAQVLLHHAAGATCAEALDRPRWVVGGLGAHEPRDQVMHERRLPSSTVGALAGAGLPMRSLEAYDDDVGHAQVIAVIDGGFDAASDPRSDGAARVISG